MTPEIGRVPFTEAIDFLRAKVPLATNAWTDAWHEMHQVSFVVAGARDMAMLADFHAAVVAAIAEGKTKVEFQREFVSIAKRYGWSYRGSPGWRSRVIFETNLRTSYSSGRWAQIDALREARPFIRYSAVMDGRTRPLHRTWHGTILPVGHPWWNTHFPPNGWSCRCTVVSLAQRDLDRRGWKVTDPAPKVDLVRREVAGRGTVEVPAGIDPGFGYNPGRGALARQAEARARDQATRVEPAIAEAAAPALRAPPIAELPAVPGPVAPLPQPRAFESVEAAAAALNDAQRDWVAGLSQRAAMAIDTYKTTSAKLMNGILRGTLPPGEFTEAEIRQAISDNVELEEALRRQLLPFDLRVFRGLRGEYGRAVGAMEVGDVIDDAGFGSTSVDQAYAARWSRTGVVLEILAPKGVPGYAYVRDVPSTSHPLQYEVLFAPRYRLRIIAKTGRVITCVMET